MTCKDCYHCDVCSKKDGMTNFYGKECACSNVEKLCQYFKNKSRIVELPFIAMIEQYLVNGKFADNIYLQKFNGRYAAVYINKNKWGTPLIDICGKYSYNTEEAEARLKELNNENSI